METMVADAIAVLERLLAVVAAGEVEAAAETVAALRGASLALSAVRDTTV